jgi:hypothetical protein
METQQEIPTFVRMCIAIVLLLGFVAFGYWVHNGHWPWEQNAKQPAITQAVFYFPILFHQLFVRLKHFGRCCWRVFCNQCCFRRTFKARTCWDKTPDDNVFL